jgi:hypothetical protein
MGRPKADVTFTIHYSFMAPDDDLKKGLDYFNLCEYVESMLPDQINRGYGKHSILGYINEISAAELNTRRDQGYRSGDLIGRAYGDVIRHDRVREILRTSVEEASEVAEEVTLPPSGEDEGEKIYQVQSALVRGDRGEVRRLRSSAGEDGREAARPGVPENPRGNRLQRLCRGSS